MVGYTAGCRIVEENGSKKSQQVYPCGCIVSYCLCGCGNAPEQRDCATHAAAEEMLVSLEGVARILEAFSYTTKLGKNQAARLAEAKELIKRAKPKA